jgi:hypothetical protein
MRCGNKGEVANRGYNERIVCADNQRLNQAASEPLLMCHASELNARVYSEDRIFRDL